MQKSKFFSFLSGCMISQNLCAFATVKYGSLITEIKGSVGGHTFKGTAAGGSMQTKINRSASGRGSGKLTKADAGRVILPIKNLSTNASAWRSLTVEQRTAWSAAAPDFPFLNKFGEPYTGSGFQLFMQCNNNLLNIAESPLTEPPSTSELINCPPFTITQNIGLGQKMILTIDVPANYTLTMYASSNQSAGKQFERGRMKAILQQPAGSTGADIIDDAYQAVFGSLSANYNIWFEGKLTKADAGRQSQSFVVQATF